MPPWHRKTLLFSRAASGKASNTWGADRWRCGRVKADGHKPSVQGNGHCRGCWAASQLGPPAKIIDHPAGAGRTCMTASHTASVERRWHSPQKPNSTVICAER